jgi:hypothetical protein
MTHSGWSQTPTAPPKKGLSFRGDTGQAKWRRSSCNAAFMQPWVASQAFEAMRPITRLPGDDHLMTKFLELRESEVRMFIGKKIITSTLGLSLLAAPLSAGTYEVPRTIDRSHRDYDHRDERRDDRRDFDRHDNWHGQRADWQRFGTVTVGRHEERDLVEVPGHQRFRAIMFRVADGDLVLEDLKVTFDDDSTYSPDTKIVFREGERSGIIDLPGYSRDIKRIRFLHRSLNRSGAVVEVYGVR